MTETTEIKISDWQLGFITFCKKMDKRGEPKKELKPRGKIVKHLEVCSSCGGKYIVSADFLSL